MVRRSRSKGGLIDDDEGMDNNGREHRAAMNENELAVKERNLKNRELSLSEMEKIINDRKETISKREMNLKQSGIFDFVEVFIREGQVMPADREALAELVFNLSETSLKFTQDGKVVEQLPAAFLKDFLSNLPIRNPEVIARKAVDYLGKQLEAGREISYSEAVDWVIRAGKLP